MLDTLSAEYTQQPLTYADKIIQHMQKWANLLYDDNGREQHA